MIEPISHANLSALTRLTLALWPECTYEEEYKNGLKLLQSDRDTAFLYKTVEGEYVAFAILSLRYEHVEGTASSPVGYLEGIYVAPAHRQSGIARQLVEAGEAWSRSKGCTEFASDAEWHNTASQQFHQSVGFTEVNRVVCYRKGL